MKKISSGNICLATFLLPVVLLSSCHIFKRSAHTTSSEKIAQVKTDTVQQLRDTTAAITPLKDTIATVIPAPKHADSLTSAASNPLLTAVGAVWQRPLNYTTFSGKAKMKYEGGNNSHEFTANFRVNKDKVIWVMITAFGGMFTVARAYITPDSMKFINYINKEVVEMSLSQAAGLLPTPADFTMLQNLIIGSPLKQTGVAKTIEDLGNKWLLQVEDNQYVQKNEYSKSDTTLQAGKLNTRNPNGPQATINYSNYAVINGIKFSNVRAVDLSNNGEQYHLSMDFTSAEFNPNIDFPFSIPKNFTIKQ